MFKKGLIFMFIVLVLLQFIPQHRINHKVDEALALQASPDVMDILKKSCYDCHSNETKYTALASIAPFSFAISSHIADARKALNFSEYKKIPQDIKKARLQRAIKTLNNEMMPLPSYLYFHKEAKLSKDDKKILTQWFEKELSKSFN